MLDFSHFLFIWIISTLNIVTASTQKQIIESFYVRSEIKYRFATTQIASKVRNVAGTAQEIVFEVTLPKDAFITRFSMIVDNKMINGEVKEKSQALEEYQTAVNNELSAGHVQFRHSNSFDVSVNIANGSLVAFTLTYEEVMTRKKGIYEQEIILNPGMPVKNFVLEVNIQENKDLKFVKTPALREDTLTDQDENSDNPLVTISRPSSRSAQILFKPSQSEQGEGGFASKFVTQYDVERGQDGDVLLYNGYFVHFYAPNLPSMNKDIIFVLDVSGSMYGQKLAQMKQAMYTILSDLQFGDRFNLMKFGSNVNKWKQSIVTVTESSIKEATRFVREIKAAGSTFSEGALTQALEQFRKKDNSRISMIFFMTDGKPSQGIKDHKELNKKVKSLNKLGIIVYGLAFGKSADFNSMKELSSQNDGFARKIYEADDAALQVSTLYEEISLITAKGVAVDYLDVTGEEFKTTERNFPVLYKDSEIIICGKIPSDLERFHIIVNGQKLKGELQTQLVFEDIKAIELEKSDVESTRLTGTSIGSFIERMWAFTKIRQLYKDVETASNSGVKASINREILDLSLKYQFVTTMSSMVVTSIDETIGTGFGESVVKKRSSTGRNSDSKAMPPKSNPNRQPSAPVKPSNNVNGPRVRSGLGRDQVLTRSINSINNKNTENSDSEAVAFLGKSVTINVLFLAVSSIYLISKTDRAV